MYNVGKVLVSDKALLAWLQLPQGKILGISHNNPRLDTVEIIIEDDKMPELGESYHIPIVDVQNLIREE